MDFGVLRDHHRVGQDVRARIHEDNLVSAPVLVKRPLDGGSIISNSVT